MPRFTVCITLINESVYGLFSGVNMTIWMTIVDSVVPGVYMDPLVEGIASQRNRTHQKLRPGV